MPHCLDHSGSLPETWGPLRELTYGAERKDPENGSIQIVTIPVMKAVLKLKIGETEETPRKPVNGDNGGSEMTDFATVKQGRWPTTTYHPELQGLQWMCCSTSLKVQRCGSCGAEEWVCQD